MPKLYTIGHSTHTMKEFLSILLAYQITYIVDVRSIPKSRHVPWFNENKLKIALSRYSIRYTHLSALGGLRRTHKESINKGWHNPSFRGYADYMQTPDFYFGLKSLNKMLKRGQKVAIMCAEALPWRCHRSLIADAELIRGISVTHIMSKTNTHIHDLTPFAKINRKKRPIQIFYPSDNE